MRHPCSCAAPQQPKPLQLDQQEISRLQEQAKAHVEAKAANKREKEKLTVPAPKQRRLAVGAEPGSSNTIVSRFERKWL